MAFLQPAPDILAGIRNAQSHAEQAASLRLLKNEVAGHVQRKEKWLERGALEPVVKILQTARAPAGGRNGRRDSRGVSAHPRRLTEEEEVRLQALQLLAIFANGGPSFLEPLQAAGAIQVILSNVFPLDNPPLIVLTALRALSNIREATSLAVPSSLGPAALADLIFTPLCLGAFHSILASESAAPIVQEQKRLASGLVGRLCCQDKHRSALANYGILDALATTLASFAVARGEVVPGAEKLGRVDGLADMIPAPAQRGASLALTLEAVSAIVYESRFRTCMLLCSPALMAVFPNADFFPPDGGSRSAHWSTLETAGLGCSRSKNPGAMDYLLPIVPSYPRMSAPSRFAEFPHLSSSPSNSGSDGLAANGRPAVTSASIGKVFSGWDPICFGAASAPADEADDQESPAIPWLIHLVRSASDLERVMAASVLASVFKAGFASPEREASIGCLVIPVLCQLIKDMAFAAETGPVSADPALLDSRVALRWAILERTPAVLARLIAGSEALQKCAYDCGIARVVCKLLFESYEPIPEQSAPRPWTAVPAANKASAGRQHYEGGDLNLASRLGRPGRLPLYRHRLAVRESTLRLIAALVSFKEEYRKALVEQDVVAYVVESLSPVPDKPKQGKERARRGGAATAASAAATAAEPSPYGTNTAPVLVAACHVVRLLSRSVSVLRTSLEDHGVARSLYELLKHSDKEVQVAACGALCNLVLGVSPMKRPLVSMGVVKTLCELAHSLDAEIRHNAMWALKHLVLEADNDLKKHCLEELEPGWLIQLICDDTEDEALHNRLRRRRPFDDDDDDDEDNDVEDEDEDMDPDADEYHEYPGDDDDDDEVEDVEGVGAEEGVRPWLWPALYRTTSTRSSSQRGESVRMQRAQRTLAALRETEVSPVQKARSDDLAVQEQGLGFIRNLIGLPESSGTSPESSQDLAEMVDYLFSEVGQDRLFQILASKLRERVLHAFERRRRRQQRPKASGASGSGNWSGTTGREARVLYPQPRIVNAVALILVHIAASIPRHRQLVVAQTELLGLLAGHFGSRDSGVRWALCHLVTNLVWKDDQSDMQACAQRGLELRKLGFLSRLEALERDDSELGVRQRAKAAVWSLEQAMSR